MTHHQIRIYSAANDWQTIFVALDPHAMLTALHCALRRNPRTMDAWARALRGCVQLLEQREGFDYELRPAAPDFRITVIQDGVVVFEGSAFRFQQRYWGR